MDGWQLFDDAAQPDLPTIRSMLGTSPGFDERTARAVREALREVDTRPQTIAAADRAQTQLVEVLAAHRHRSAAFLAVYHGITVAVIDALERGQIGPRPFFERLPGKFAERHFDGVKAELGLDGAGDAGRYGLWRPSFALDHRAQEPPMACFTLGMCCHINFDLACSLDETIRELGYANDRAALAEIERGHNFVDTILAAEVEHSTELLADQMDCAMSKKILEMGATKTVGDVSMTMIRRWRAKTFVHALQLVAAPDDPARAAVRADIYRAGARKAVRLVHTLPGLIEGTLRGTWFAG